MGPAARGRRVDRAGLQSATMPLLRRFLARLPRTRVSRIGLASESAAWSALRGGHVARFEVTKGHGVRAGKVKTGWRVRDDGWRSDPCHRRGV